jgi:hypothetical protein
MPPNATPKRDLISTLAAIGTPTIVFVWLIAVGWKWAAVWVGGFAAVVIILLWLFPPAIDDQGISDGESPD